MKFILMGKWKSTNENFENAGVDRLQWDWANNMKVNFDEEMWWQQMGWKSMGEFCENK
jgi:hypothetical protein